MSGERSQEAQRLAERVVSGGIVQKATERLVYQIVEVCAEHEQENTDALRARVAKLEAALKAILDRAGPGDNSFVLDECAEIARVALKEFTPVKTGAQ